MKLVACLALGQYREREGRVCQGIFILLFFFLNIKGIFFSSLFSLVLGINLGVRLRMK
jgi:hypothetical protein